MSVWCGCLFVVCCLLVCLNCLSCLWFFLFGWYVGLSCLFNVFVCVFVLCWWGVSVYVYLFVLFCFV